MSALVSPINRMAIHDPPDLADKAAAAWRKRGWFAVHIDDPRLGWHERGSLAEIADRLYGARCPK
jgi:hypothetical protein